MNGAIRGHAWVLAMGLAWASFLVAQERPLDSFMRTGVTDSVAGNRLVVTFPPGEKWAVQLDARDVIDGQTEMIMNAQISPAYLGVAAKQNLWAHVEVQLDAQGKPAAPVKRLLVVVPTNKSKPSRKPGGFDVEEERPRGEAEERRENGELPRSLDDVKVEYNDLDAPARVAAGTFKVFGPITKARGQALSIGRLDLTLAADVEARIHLTDRVRIMPLLQAGDPVEVFGRTRERLHVFTKRIRVMPDRLIGAELEKPRPAAVARNGDKRPEKPANAESLDESPFKPVGEAALDDDPFGVNATSTVPAEKPGKVRVLKVN